MWREREGKRLQFWLYNCFVILITRNACKEDRVEIPVGFFSYLLRALWLANLVGRILQSAR